jgi:hypothetical protein
MLLKLLHPAQIALHPAATMLPGAAYFGAIEGAIPCSRADGVGLASALMERDIHALGGTQTDRSEGSLHSVDLSTFIIAIFCLIDDCIEELGPLRGRRSAPMLFDSERSSPSRSSARFLGLDQDAKLFNYFRRHYAQFFTSLGRVHRTTLTRQALNL